ncbi:TIGR02391 family protein [Methylobacterium sp. HMF5984]|uniref:TIGR02391 family protein n=1 Tax=Methylobacterium sp. HMF5984 TaxID=3367370 RepID=UPI003853A903
MHFTQSELEAIANALGDTADGLTGGEIGHLLRSCGIPDPSPSLNKRHRTYDAFVGSQNARQDRTAILAFIRKAMKPERYLRDPGRQEPLRAKLNAALSFAALAVDESGCLVASTKATTVSEARRRAGELRSDLQSRGTHPDVLSFCREELLAENYFHAVLEAVKSVGAKLRASTGLTDDGNSLVERALGGPTPMLAINDLASDSEWSEQKGFANLVKGVFGMFRNPTAHAPRIHWAMAKADAEDLLTLVSLIHRRLDGARMPPRP